MSPTVLQGLTDAYAEESDGFKGSYHITQYRCYEIYDHWFPPLQHITLSSAEYLKCEPICTQMRSVPKIFFRYKMKEEWYWTLKEKHQCYPKICFNYKGKEERLLADMKEKYRCYQGLLYVWSATKAIANLQQEALLLIAVGFMVLIAGVFLKLLASIFLELWAILSLALGFYRTAITLCKWSYHATQYRCTEIYDHWFPPPLPPIDERAPASPFTASTQRLALAKALHHRLGSNSHAVLLPWDLVSSVEDLLYDEDYTPASFEVDSPSSSSDDDDIIPIDEVAGCGPQIDSYDHDDIRFVPILYLYDHDDISSSSGDE